METIKKIAFITRSTLYTVPGGDTVQVLQTAKFLEKLGLAIDIRLSNEPLSYRDYDLLHFFNITRPADILYHVKKSGKRYVISTILCNYSEYDKYHRKGIGLLFKYLPPNGIEYIKTIARWLLGKDHLASAEYLWQGQRKSVIKALKGAELILPNSQSEYLRIVQEYKFKAKYQTITNGVDPEVFRAANITKKDKWLILCVARIEGIKNQINLIKALNNTEFKLLIIGAHAPNQAGYYKQCLDIAAGNVKFIDHLQQHELVKFYEAAKVHILPSWFETTGLSSVEAVAMGCNIVITDKGDTREYFGDDAIYCDPAEPPTILEAIKKASAATFNEDFRHRVLKEFTWQQAAQQTFNAYQSILEV